MNRLDKKCFIASTGTHLFLALLLVFGSAFFISRESFAKMFKKDDLDAYHASLKQEFDASIDKNIAGILCMGMDPGAVNVFARWAMDRLDTATSIRVLDGDNAEVKGYRFAVLAREAGLPLAILTNGTTRADPLATLKLAADCGNTLETAVCALA